MHISHSNLIFLYFLIRFSDYGTLHIIAIVKTSRFMKSDRRFDGLIMIVPFAWEMTILPPRLN